MNRRTLLKQAGMMTAGWVILPTDAASRIGHAETAPATPSRIVSSEAANAPLKGDNLTATPRPAPRHTETPDTSDELTVFTPVDHGKALINPGMGWTMHFYSNVISNYGSRLKPSDTLDSFPGVSAVYLRLPWSFIEPQKNKFAWETLDTPAQRWIDSGKQVAFRISATESWMYYATPKWVFDEGAVGYEVDKIFEPDYDDPLFLEYVERFVMAMAARYDGNPSVAFVDVGHYGMWGEGHTVITSPKHGKTWGFETMKKHIDIYCRHFKKTLLCISDDFAGHDLRGDRFPITDYAFSRGVSLRDDSILVQNSPNHWYHDEMAQLFWPTLPVILEHEHYGGSVQRGAWNGDLLVQSVEDYHASFMSVHWWPEELLEKNRSFIDRINRRIGFRLQLSRLEWPTKVQLGEEFVVRSAWRNTGVAPCYAGGYPCLTLKDEQGGIVSVLVDDRLDVKTLPVDQPDKASPAVITSAFTIAFAFADRSGNYFRACQPGTYDVFVSVGKRDGTPLYELPYDHSDGKKRYKMGQIIVEERRG